MGRQFWENQEPERHGTLMAELVKREAMHTPTNLIVSDPNEQGRELD